MIFLRHKSILGHGTVTVFVSTIIAKCCYVFFIIRSLGQDLPGSVKEEPKEASTPRKRALDLLPGASPQKPAGIPSSSPRGNSEAAQKSTPRKGELTETEESVTGYVNNRKVLPCRVCGMIFLEMPKRGRECFEHQRDSAGLLKHLQNCVSTNPKDADIKQNLVWFVDQRKNAKEPPSEYSREVLQYAQDNPSRGVGFSRVGNYCMHRNIEETVGRTITNKGVKTVEMHKERFQLWGAGIALPPDYLESWWQQMFREYDHDDTDQVDEMGPSFSKLQLAVPVENFGIAKLQEEHNKRSQLMSKTKKITSAEEIDEAAKSVSTGLVGFNDSTFAKTGGALVAQLAKMGKTDIATSSGSSALSLTSTGTLAHLTVGSEAIFTQEKPKGVKKMNVEKERTKLQESVHGAMKMIGSDAAALLTAAVSCLQIGFDVKDEMPTVGKWNDILKNKIEWLKHTLTDAEPYNSSTDESALQNACSSDPQFALLQTAEAKVSILITSMKEADETKRQAADELEPSLPHPDFLIQTDFDVLFTFSLSQGD